MKPTFFLLFLLFFSNGYSQSTASLTSSDSLEFKSLFNTKMREGVACYRIPALVTAPNGDLLAAIDERVPSCDDLRTNPDINIVLRRSTDNGNTWSPIETLVDYPLGQSASDPSMIVDKITGEIFLFYNYMDLVHEKDVYYFKYIKSPDNGKTWTLPTDITAQIAPSDWHRDFKFITSGAGTQTQNGKLLHTLVNLQKGLFVFASDDHGKTWTLLNTPIKPGDESKILELSDGRWMINSRVNKAGLRYVHISTDQGQSWTSRPDTTLSDPSCNAGFILYPSSFILINHPSSLIPPQSNILLFSNPNSKDQRMNLSMRLSHDNGKSWSAGRTIYTGSSAYSALCVLKNGDIGVFFEKDDYSDNVFVIVTLEWLTDWSVLK